MINQDCIYTNRKEVSGWSEINWERILVGLQTQTAKMNVQQVAVKVLGFIDMGKLVAKVHGSLIVP